LPESALLAAHARRGAYTDCFSLTVPGQVDLATWVEAFLTGRLFRLERRVLALVRLPSTDDQARALARGEADRFAAWRLEARTADELLLDAGQTRLWLSVQPRPGPTPATTLRMGSAVLPMRPGGGFGFLFHALIGLHLRYSRWLLTGGARRLTPAPAPRPASPPPETP
jgi:hypothetical protein